jgi:hypothetical protein
MFGNYGSAALKQVGNRLTGSAEGKLSVQDKIAKDKFISDFIGRANTNLTSAIQSGLVDPKVKAGAPGAVEPQQNATPAPSATTTQQPATSAAPKTPAEIQKEKLAAAAKVAQGQMAANPAPTQQAPAQSQTDVGGRPNPYMSAAANQPAPAQQSKMTPQQTAALKGRLKAGATPTSGQSGFKNYVGGSGQVQRESRYAKLDYILESIINIDEAQEAQSISEYLQNMFNQYLGIPITDPKAKVQVKTLADQAQASYPKIKDALTKMANLGFAISYSQGSGASATQGADATAPQQSSGASVFSQGMQQGLGGTAGGTASQPSASASNTSTTTAQDNSAYDQIMSLVGKLSAEEKQKLLATLQEPAAGGQGAFDQMGKQLQQPKTTADPVADRQQKLNTNKVKAGNKGAPTSAEYDKFDKLAQQALAKQA